MLIQCYNLKKNLSNKNNFFLAKNEGGGSEGGKGSSHLALFFSKHIFLISKFPKDFNNFSFIDYL